MKRLSMALALFLAGCSGRCAVEVQSKVLDSGTVARSSTVSDAPSTQTVTSTGATSAAPDAGSSGQDNLFRTAIILWLMTRN